MNANTIDISVVSFCCVVPDKLHLGHDFHVCLAWISIFC